MSKLKEKSEFNIEAARLLLNENLYAPSVHCSYYSCFQLLKFTIKDFFGIDYNTQSNNISQTQQKSHQYVINYVTKELISLSGSSESRRIKRKIKDLKQHREEADYQNVEVTSSKGNEAFIIAKEIRSYIVENFNV